MDIDETSIVTFPEGVPGFESHTRFVFVPHRTADPEKSSPFMWLQSADDGKLAFLITNPRLFFPDYQPSIGSADRQAIGADAEDAELHVYTLLTVPSGNPAGITANLLAPVVINLANLTGRQVIVNDDRYSLRHRLVPETKPSILEPEIATRPVPAEEEYAVR